MGLGGHKPTHLNQTPNTNGIAVGVSLRGIIFVDKRETTQTVG